MPKAILLSGYYPSKMESWDAWREEWSMRPHADPDWVWFDGYYTEDEAREHLRLATEHDRKGWDDA